MPQPDWLQKLLLLPFWKGWLRYILGVLLLVIAVGAFIANALGVGFGVDNEVATLLAVQGYGILATEWETEHAVAKVEDRVETLEMKP